MVEVDEFIAPWCPEAVAASRGPRIGVFTMDVKENSD